MKIIRPVVKYGKSSFFHNRRSHIYKFSEQYFMKSQHKSYDQGEIQIFVPK